MKSLGKELDRREAVYKSKETYQLFMKNGEKKVFERIDFETRNNTKLLVLSMEVEAISAETPRAVQRIKDMFYNVPGLNQGYIHGRQTWHGDFARFIVANMVP